MDAQTRLIAELRKRQLGFVPAETDAEFAARLGMSRPMWSLLRRSKLNLSLPLLQGILAAYPDLRALATELLSVPSDAMKNAPSASRLTGVSV